MFDKKKRPRSILVIELSSFEYRIDFSRVWALQASGGD